MGNFNNFCRSDHLMLTFALADFETVSLAGGGNRCWWLAGVLQVFSKSEEWRPKRLVGTSAGASIAAASLTGSLEAAIDSCRRLYAANASLWRGKRGEWFAHEYIYPTWVNSFLTTHAFARLQESAVELFVSVCRLPKLLPPNVGLALGLATYAIDRHRKFVLHPRLAYRFGLREEVFLLQRERSAAAAANLLISAAAAPPFIARRTVAGRYAVDGGFIDNSPRLTPVEPSDRHLMLVTRHNPKRPMSFVHDGRVYLQPSRPVPVSTWDCTSRTDIENAVALGRIDALVTLHG